MSRELSFLLESIEDSSRTIRNVAESAQVIGRVAQDLAETLSRGGKLLACGNGGSAAEAQHLTSEWVGRFVRDRRSYPAIALTADGALLTCLANDYGVEDIFARQVEGLGAAGDVIVGFSTSGNSENIIKALLTAKEKGIRTVAILGRDGGRTKGLADHEVIVSSFITARIQEAHGLIVHLVCEETERLLGHK